MPKRITEKGNGKYLLFVSLGYDQNGKQLYRSKTVTAKSIRDAEKKWSEFKVSLGKASGEVMKVHSFYEYYKENYENKKLAIGTIERNEYLFRRIDTALGHKSMDKVEPSDILLFLDMLKRAGQSDSSIVKHYTLLHSLFAKAIQWQMITFNPCDHIDKPQKVKVEKNILEIEDCKRFLKCVDKYAPLIYKVCTYLSISTGVRRGELFGLQFKNIDTENNSLFIMQQALYSKEKGLYLKPSTKNYKNRHVSIPPSVTKLILERKEQIITQKNLLANHWEGAEDIEDVFLCCNDKGAMSYGFRYSQWLSSFLKDNGFKHITPHSFRHMAATYLITSGTDLRTVSGKLGHSNMSTTMTEYAHLLNSAEKETANTIETIISH